MTAAWDDYEAARTNTDAALARAFDIAAIRAELEALLPAPGDPKQTRTTSTHTEAQRPANWLPGDDDDRADDRAEQWHADRGASSGREADYAAGVEQDMAERGGLR